MAVICFLTTHMILSLFSYSRMPSAFLLRDARHALHDVHLTSDIYQPFSTSILKSASLVSKFSGDFFQ